MQLTTCVNHSLQRILQEHEAYLSLLKQARFQESSFWYVWDQQFLLDEVENHVREPKQALRL